MNPPRFLIRIPSPIGRLQLTADDAAITSLQIEVDGSLPFDLLVDSSSPLLVQCADELTQYFAGTRREFTVPIAQTGTPFQRAVWAIIESIGYGNHTTYGEIAEAVGKSRAGRAVGAAVAAHPVPLIVGTHRVLAADGKVSGFNHGAGPKTKAWLLEHELIAHAA
jgi:methylated-DNA-[protein]-cysteine S-methyltransferase